MLLNPHDLLVEARAGGWAIGGFNVYDLESARAVIEAAEQTRGPVLVQTSEGAVHHAGLDQIVAIVRSLAQASPAPVALHLDHGKSAELARAAVDAGYTSVMIDCSAESFEANMRTTSEIVKYAHAHGVHVEAELGTIGGVEDVGEQDRERLLTDPDQAERFAAETGVDILAIAIGTAHGAYKFTGTPELDFERLEEIAGRVEQPLVLHGASTLLADQVQRAERYGAKLPHAQGVPEEMLRRAIGMGIAKINTDSDLRLAALGRMREVLTERPDLFNMYELMGEVQAAIRDETIERIRLFGSEGKAA